MDRRASNWIKQQQKLGFTIILQRSLLYEWAWRISAFLFLALPPSLRLHLQWQRFMHPTILNGGSSHYVYYVVILLIYNYSRILIRLCICFISYYNFIFLSFFSDSSSSSSLRIRLAGLHSIVMAIPVSQYRIVLGEMENWNILWSHRVEHNENDVILSRKTMYHGLYFFVLAFSFSFFSTTLNKMFWIWSYATTMAIMRYKN